MSGLTDEEQNHWLGQCEEYNWSRKELRKQLKAAFSGYDPDAQPLEFASEDEAAGNVEAEGNESAVIGDASEAGEGSAALQAFMRDLPQSPLEADTERAQISLHLAYGALDAPVEGGNAVTRILANEQLRVSCWVTSEWHVHDTKDHAFLGSLNHTSIRLEVCYFLPPNASALHLGYVHSFADARYLLADHLLTRQREGMRHVPTARAEEETSGTEEEASQAHEETADVEDRQEELRPDAHVDAAGGHSGGEALAQPVAQGGVAVSSEPAADVSPNAGASGTPVSSASVESVQAGEAGSTQRMDAYPDAVVAMAGGENAAGERADTQAGKQVDGQRWTPTAKDIAEAEAVADMQALDDVCLDCGDVLGLLKLGGFDNEDEAAMVVPGTVEAFCDYWPPILRGLLMYVREAMEGRLVVESEDLALLAALAARRRPGQEGPISTAAYLHENIAQWAEQAGVTLAKDEDEEGVPTGAGEGSSAAPIGIGMN